MHKCTTDKVKQPTLFETSHLLNLFGVLGKKQTKRTSSSLYFSTNESQDHCDETIQDGRHELRGLKLQSNATDRLSSGLKK